MTPTHGRGESSFILGRRPALDGLRGVAVLAVMAYHTGPRSLFQGGFLGVDVFFVLSGFLVTALLLQKYQQIGTFQLTQFYFRRALRLFPALVVMLAVCGVFAAFRTRPDRAREIYRAAMWTACFAANWHWLGPVRMDLLGHAWSLSLEGQFYVVWPVLLSLMLWTGARLRIVAGLVVVGIAAAALLRAVLWIYPWPTECGAIVMCLVSRTDSLLAGCVVGLLAFSNGLPQSPHARLALQVMAFAAAVVLLGLVVTADSDAAFMRCGGFTVAAASAAVVVAALVQSPPSGIARVLSAPVLVWMGRISYGLYLWHFPLLSIAPKMTHGLFPAARHVPGLDGLLAFGMAFAAATLSYYAVERPCLRRKDRPIRREPVSPSRPSSVSVWEGRARSAKQGQAAFSPLLGAAGSPAILPNRDTSCVRRWLRPRRRPGNL